MSDAPTSSRKIVGWGFGLWLFGYLLGMVFFALVPPAQIGWYVTPFGITATCIVLWKWVPVATLPDAFIVGIVWCVIAVVCDYLSIVKLLAPVDGYYKFDVYLYYVLTFILPFAAAWIRQRAHHG